MQKICKNFTQKKYFFSAFCNIFAIILQFFCKFFANFLQFFCKFFAHLFQNICAKIFAKNVKKKFFFCVKFLQILNLHTDFRPREESVRLWMNLLAIFFSNKFWQNPKKDFPRWCKFNLVWLNTIHSCIILYFILYTVHNTHRYSSFLTRNRGILWRGIPREENRRGKQGIDRPNKKLF